MSAILKAWELVKKSMTPSTNDPFDKQLDTIDWVYRNECKVIEKFIKDNLPQEPKVEVHPNQLTIDDL